MELVLSQVGVIGTELLVARERTMAGRTAVQAVGTNGRATERAGDRELSRAGR